MSGADLYVIEYKLNGESKSFIIRAASMSSAAACQWASCDAGAIPIPKFGKPQLKKLSKQMVEGYGITDVRWRESARLAWTEVRNS